MATFYYKAVAKGGSLIDGSLEGSDDKAVALRLQEMGLIPIQIAGHQASSPFKLNLKWSFRKIGSKEIMFFTQELSTLVNAGLPLDRSLGICRSLSQNPALQSLVEEVLQGIKQGKRLQTAFHPILRHFQSCTSIWSAPGKPAAHCLSC